MLSAQYAAALRHGASSDSLPPFLHALMSLTLPGLTQALPDSVIN